MVGVVGGAGVRFEPAAGEGAGEDGGAEDGAADGGEVVDVGVDAAGAVGVGISRGSFSKRRSRKTYGFSPPRSRPVETSVRRSICVLEECSLTPPCCSLSTWNHSMAVIKWCGHRSRRESQPVYKLAVERIIKRLTSHTLERMAK